MRSLPKKESKSIIVNSITGDEDNSSELAFYYSSYYRSFYRSTTLERSEMANMIPPFPSFSIHEDDASVGPRWKKWLKCFKCTSLPTT